MLNYVARRLLGAIPIVLGVALVIFILFNLVGGDPALQMAGKHATAQYVAEIRHAYGFDQPKFIQFLLYLKQIVTFDYGVSFATHQKITDILKRGIGPSLTLAIPAFILTTLISLIIALVVAYFRGKWIDRLAVILCVIGMSVSALAYILFGQYVLAYHFNLFPISGFEFDWATRWQYIELPLIIWVLLSVGYDVRFYRTALLEETHQDYVRTARAKGLSESRVFFKHVLKNTMIPIITNVLLEIPLLILGAFLLEHYFSIPGLGGITIDAINNSDFPVIKAMATLTSLLYILGNIMTDIVYTLVDPRMVLK